jgi:uncharacterized protein
MPVRSSISRVLKWPDAEAVAVATRAWAEREIARHQGVRRLGYYGSYARGDWGVGSDLDLIAIVASAEEPFERRALAWDLSSLPVPAGIVVYTESEWARLVDSAARFGREVEATAHWLVG